jgi:hypothetical protein
MAPGGHDRSDSAQAAGVHDDSDSSDEELGADLDGVVEFHMQLRSGRVIEVKPVSRPVKDNTRGARTLARILDRRSTRLPTHREEDEEIEVSEHVRDQPHPAVPAAATCGSKPAPAAERSSAGDALPACSTASDGAASMASYSRMLKRDASRAPKHYIGSPSPSKPSACRHAWSGLEGLPMRHSGLSDVSAMLSL